MSEAGRWCKPGLVNGTFGNRTRSNSPKTFANLTQSNVRKLNNLAIEHNRTFGNENFKNCTQTKFYLVSNKAFLLTNKPCKWIEWDRPGQRSPKRTVVDSDCWTFRQPIVRLSSSESKWVVSPSVDGIKLWSSIKFSLIFIPFCLCAKQNRTNRVDLVQLVRLSSVIELTEKFQFHYVRLLNQSNNNPTGWVRLSLIDF